MSKKKIVQRIKEILPQAFNKSLQGKRVLIPLILVVFILFGGINLYNFASQFLSPNLISSEWKVYSSKYHKYQISIPKDWTTEEIVVYGYNLGVKLSSPDKKVIMWEPISDPYTEQTNDKEKNYFMKNVQLGKYTIPSSYVFFESKKDQQVAYFITTFKFKHPENIYLPSFEIIITDDFKKNENLVLQILKTFKNTGTLPTIDDLISYSIPNGWSVDSVEKISAVSLKSPDFISYIAEGTGATIIQKGVGIYLSYNLNLPGKNLENKKRDSGFRNLNTLDTTIADVPAFVGKHDHFGNKITDYIVIKGDYSFNMVFYSANLSEEQKYQKQRDEFINSIRFK